MSENITGIIDYGMGNLHSVVNAVERLGGSAFISADKVALSRCERLILPGVGAFPDAADALDAAGLSDFIRDYIANKPLLGICLGMQLLFTRGFEFRERAGLDLIPGDVVRMTEREGRDYLIPHMGWDSLRFNKSAPPCPILDGIGDGEYVYFVHSYRAIPAVRADLAAYCDYGDEITAAVHHGNVYGTQFHPEKSESTGLKILANFLALK